MADPRRLLSIAAAGLMLATLVSCGGGDSKDSDKTSAPAPTETAAPPTTLPETPPPPPAPPAVNPLTGIEGVPAGPVIGVKIDDTANGRPQIGINAADVVYVEQAEGGLTRLLAVYASQKPEVGPVRSVRASDPELLGQYGNVAIVASGGAGHALEAVANSSLVDAQLGAVPDSYRRSPARFAPYNVLVNLETLSGAVQAGGAKDVGFAWAAADPRVAAAPPASRIDTSVGTTGVSFEWDPSINRYVRLIDGVRQAAESGDPVATPNVLVQLCAVEPDYDDVDVNGSPSSFTHTVGSGPAVLFREGHRIDGTWSRPSLESPTTFVDAGGATLQLAPGGVWVVLATQGAPVASG